MNLEVTVKTHLDLIAECGCNLWPPFAQWGLG